MTYRFKLLDFVFKERAFLGSAVPTENLELHHKRLGHRNRRDLGHAIKQKLLSGVSPSAVVNKKTGLCDCCVEAKSKHHWFSKTATDALPVRTKSLATQSSVIKRVVTDIKGPFSVKGCRQEMYMQLFTEEGTKVCVCKCMATKSQALSNLKDYVTVDLASEGQKLLKYHSDAAPKLICRDTVLFLAGHNCKVSCSPPYTPERDGLAERRNRTSWESAYAMLLGCSLPAMFWTFAVVYVTVVANTLPTDTAQCWLLPLQAKYGIVPDVHIFRIFGCVAYVHVNAEVRDSTFAEKGYQG